jgi:hypothetical protein
MTSEPLQLQVEVSATVGCTAASKIELINFSSPVVRKLHTNRIIADYREKPVLPSSLGRIEVHSQVGGNPKPFWRRQEGCPPTLLFVVGFLLKNTNN